MTRSLIKQLVYTEKEKCRVCYTCVRECPVKAISISNGQAEVIDKRCIGCGNCTRVCSQGAKVYIKFIDEISALFADKSKKTAAIVAPSFPAEFEEITDYKIFVGMLRKIGFDYVAEVAFGADMVASEYDKILENPNSPPSISSDCPAIVYYVEHYYPELVPSLAPVVSPMIAMNRIMKKKYGDDINIVFIGPCVAKKAESDEIKFVITFAELREIFSIFNITPNNVEPFEFDPPRSGKAAIFPISRGLLQTVKVTKEMAEEKVIVAEGRHEFREAINEFAKGLLNQHIELLCCEGCIMGPGTSLHGKKFVRRNRIQKYVQQKLKNFNAEEWEQWVKEFSEVDYTQKFAAKDRRIDRPDENLIKETLEKMGKTTKQDMLNCGACGYESCEEHAIAIIQGLAEIEMCLPKTIEKLHKSIQDLNISNSSLANAQEALKQSEKLATMGQLSAGIAHELNNPLGVITMYSNILLDEAKEDDPVRQDLQLIAEQAERCKKIVKGLLNFARKNQVYLTEANMQQFVQKSIESVIKPENIIIEFIQNIKNPNAFIDIDQMMQVLTNLEKNAVEAMPKGGKLTITLSDDENQISIAIQDTGTGISKENMDKLFTPFFTTKTMGKGTGLGLPLIYGIIKMHKGQITVTSNDNPDKGITGTTFTVTIPRNPNLIQFNEQ